MHKRRIFQLYFISPKKNKNNIKPCSEPVEWLWASLLCALFSQKVRRLASFTTHAPCRAESRRHICWEWRMNQTLPCCSLSLQTSKPLRRILPSLKLLQMPLPRFTFDPLFNNRLRSANLVFLFCLLFLSLGGVWGACLHLQGCCYILFFHNAV